MSLLPGRILPQTEPLGTVNEDGTVIIEKNWWLLLYNLALQTLGTGAGIPADQLIDLESADLDAIDADAIALRAPLAALANLLPTDADPAPSLSDARNALLLAQDAVLPDPAPQAQPVATVTVGASPFIYTASFSGSVAITGGTVSAIALIRQGASIATGLTTGLIPVSRRDQVQVTYTALPTMTFIPGSSA
jgi:hypothetical protein